jgi:hypothetical protein
MRLSISLDPELHATALARARARGISLSKELNALLRMALEGHAKGSVGASTRLSTKGRRRFPVSLGHLPVSSEEVARAEEE